MSSVCLCLCSCICVWFLCLVCVWCLSSSVFVSICLLCVFVCVVQVLCGCYSMSSTMTSSYPRNHFCSGVIKVTRASRPVAALLYCQSTSSTNGWKRIPPASCSNIQDNYRTVLIGLVVLVVVEQIGCVVAMAGGEHHQLVVIASWGNYNCYTQCL